MTRSYNWRTDPEFKLSTTHRRAWMRPQVQLLLDKLDGMKVVKELGVPEEIMWRMAFWHLHRNGEMVRLGNIATRISALWLGMIKNEQGQPAYIFGEPQTTMEWGKLTTTVTGVATGTSLPAPLDIVEDRTPEQLARDGDSPPEFRSQLQAHMTRPDMKEAIQTAIKSHVPKIGSPAWMIKCTCGRDYAHEDEWANHVRVRLNRIILDEWPPIGESNG